MKSKDYDQEDIVKFHSHMYLHSLSHLMGMTTISILREFSINPGQVGILFFLKKYGVMSQRDLANKLGIAPPSVTVAIRKMEKLGLVNKKGDEKDQRIFKIQISPLGDEKLEEVFQSVKKLDEIIYKGFSKEERKEAESMMLKIINNLKEYKAENKASMKKNMKMFKDEHHNHF
ncbi:MAG: MarR family transcriptional regulator [Lachnospiraceae bacterium]|jgi:DNA-binding MarR family transcriptional regulator|nr:MarR family transcriptional regulator [Lachnospiraceae bacterium]